MLPNNPQLDYDVIRRRTAVELQNQKRRAQIGLFAANVVIFLVFAVLVWFALPTEPGYTPSEPEMAAQFMMTIGWLTGLLLHGISAFTIGSRNSERRMRQRIMAREIQYAMLGVDDDAVLDDLEPVKAKRGANGQLRLSDEGELLDIVDDDWPHSQGDRAARS